MNTITITHSEGDTLVITTFTSIDNDFKEYTKTTEYVETPYMNASVDNTEILTEDLLESLVFSCIADEDTEENETIKRYF